jgi:hypothetical protein
MSSYLRLAAMIIGTIFLAIAFPAKKTASSEEFVDHTVRAGETVSLICIDYFGQFTSAMIPVISKENPGIKNINLIYPGQKLHLRNPDYTAPAPSAESKLFEKKIAAVQGVVTCVVGEAFYVPVSGGAKKKLAANTVVVPGDVIQTAATGRVELIINRETVVRIRENTRLTVDTFRDPAKTASKTHVAFSVGSVWAKMKKFRDKVSRFELELPTAIAGVHGTVYQASVATDSSAEVKVYDGEVAVRGVEKGAPAQSGGINEVSGPGEVSGPDEVSMEQWTALVHEMQKIRIDKNGKNHGVESFTKAHNDSWEDWNSERDKRISEMFEETE